MISKQQIEFQQDQGTQQSIQTDSISIFNKYDDSYLIVNYPSIYNQNPSIKSNSVQDNSTIFESIYQLQQFLNNQVRDLGDQRSEHSEQEKSEQSLTNTNVEAPHDSFQLKCGHSNLKLYAKGMCQNCYKKYEKKDVPWNCLHSDLKVYAKGMCQNCYKNKLKKQKPWNCEHTDLLNYAKGLCQNCYKKYGRQNKPWMCEHTNEELYKRGMCQDCYFKLGEGYKYSWNCEHSQSYNYSKGMCENCFIEEQQKYLNKNKRKIGEWRCEHTHLQQYAQGLCYNCYNKQKRTQKPWNCIHTDLQNYAKGFCQNCYKKYRKQKIKECLNEIQYETKLNYNSKKIQKSKAYKCEHTKKIQYCYGLCKQCYILQKQMKQ